MTNNKNSIIAKISLIIFTLVLTIFVIYYGFLHIQIKGFLVKEGQARITGESEAMCAEVEMLISKYETIVEQGAINPDFIDLVKEINKPEDKKNNSLYNRVVKHLMKISDLDDNISHTFIAITKANDIITDILDYQIHEGYNLITRDWYNQTITNNKTIITTPYLDLITNQEAITISTPIKVNNQIIGVFGVDISIEDINKIMEEKNDKSRAEIGIVYSDGEVLFAPSMLDEDNKDKKIFISELIYGDVTDEILSNKNGLSKYEHNGKGKYIAYNLVENTNLIVYSSTYESDMLGPINQFIYLNLGILLVLILLVIIITTLLERSFSRPIAKICQEVDRYSKTNTIFIPKKYLERDDEIGVLAKGITYMINNISYVIYQLEDKNRELINTKESINKDRLLITTVLRSLGDGVISTDQSGIITIMNKIAEELTGWNHYDALGLSIESVFRCIKEGTDEFNPISEVISANETIELEEDVMIINKDGEKTPIEGNISLISDENGDITGVVVVFRDYSIKKREQDKIMFLSYHDQLTGLYNRRFFEEELERIDNENYLPISLAMLDVNGLKLTNDAFGHHIGDKLLKKVSDIIKYTCRKEDIISRVGGDEFVIIFKNTDFKDAYEIVKRIYKEVEGVRINDIMISVSIGLETKDNLNQNIMDIFNKAEEQMYRKKIVESQSMRNETIKMILKTLHETNKRESIHSENVSKISRRIGEALKLDSELLREIEIAGILHDIGKIVVDSNILNKPDKLSDSEYEVIKRHPEVGYHILKSVDTYSILSEYVLSHHEKWDGTGYPRGLKGREAPLIARIISVADAYDAMTSDRPYREAMSKEEAKEELIRCSGTQFDPDIVNIFIEEVEL